MQIIDDYIRLLSSKNEAAIGCAIPFSLDEVAAALCCTQRNAKLVVTKLMERNWINWTPGRGRGNRSLIQFQVEPHDVIDGIAREWVYQGQVQKALSLIEAYAPSHQALADHFSHWFRGYFGMHQQRDGEKTTDTLRLRLDHPVLSLDPARAWLRSESHLIKQLYDSLVAYQPATGTIKPRLAYHWEVNERADQWTFYLRKGVLFHHGQPLSAYDVEASFARIQDPANGSYYRWMLQSVERTQVVGERVIRFFLHEPNHLFLQLLASEYLSIVPRAYSEQMAGEFARLPIGTGPFKVVRNDESMLVLEAFESYFRERAHLDRIEFAIIKDDGLTARFLDETAYGIRHETVQNGNGLPRAIKDWNLMERTEWSVQYIAFNLRKNGPMQDPLFRKALAVMLDQKHLTQDLGGNRFEPVHRLLPANSSSPPPPCEQQPDVNLLLAQSAYKGEVLRLHTFTDEDHLEDSRWIAAQCAKYGVLVENYYYDAKTLLTSSCINEADIIHDSATLSEDMKVSLLHFLLAGHSFVPFFLDDSSKEGIEEQVKRLFSIVSLEERLALLVEMESDLLKKYAYLPLYRNDSRLLAHPGLEGVTINEQGWVEYAKLWFR